MATSHIEALRGMLREEKGVLLPGVPNALGARIVADLGFKAVYLTGAGLTNMYLGLPDLGFMDLSQVAEHVMAIRSVIDLPLIADADTGFGNAINVTHTIRILEQAGASAIQIEDQHSPKRCGHFAGKELIPLSEMLGKIKAAVDSRRHDMVVLARTDACTVEGFDGCFLPFGAPGRFDGRGHHAEGGDGPVAVCKGEDISAAEEVERAVIEVIAIEIAEGHAVGAGAHEAIQGTVEEEDGIPRIGLVGQVPSDLSFAG